MDISKFMAISPLGHYVFLHRINTFGARNLENVKRWYCKNNYNLRKQLQLLTIFAQSSIVDVWQGSEFASGSEYPTVLNIPLFWIRQGSAYVSGSEYAEVTQGSEYAWIFSRHVFYIIWLIRYQGNLWKCNSCTAKSPLNQLKTTAKSWKLLCDC